MAERNGWIDEVRAIGVASTGIERPPRILSSLRSTTMNEDAIERQESWHRRSPEEREPGAIAAWSREAPNGAAYVVSIHSGGERAYELELSTIDPGDHHVRHDYHVADYGTRELAYDAAEDFVMHLDEQLEAGVLSIESPSVEATEAAIRGFTDESEGLLSRLLYRFYG